MVQKLARCILPFVLILTLTGCQKKTGTAILLPPPPLSVPPAPPPSSTPLPEEAAIEGSVSPPTLFEIAEREFETGRYAPAARAYESYLKEPESDNHRDRVLFRLGLSLALADNSSRSLGRMRDQFRVLIRSYPNSPYRSQAEYILNLHSDIERLRADSRKMTSEIQSRDEHIKRLTSELEKLKKIDLERRSTKPPFQR